MIEQDVQDIIFQLQKEKIIMLSSMEKTFLIKQLKIINKHIK